MGVHALASVENRIIIATPHIQPGNVIINTITDRKISAINNGVVINAHNGEISSLSLN